MKNILTKLTTVAATGAALSVAIALNAPQAEAVTIVNQAIDFVTPPYPVGEPVFTFCGDLGLCEPGETATFTTGSGTAPNINNNDNDTPFTFGGIIYEILDDDVQWGIVTSNFFDVEINGKIATFTGIIPPGAGFRVNRSLTGDANPVNLSGTLTSVPEPASVLGLLAFGAIGAGSALKRKKA